MHSVKLMVSALSPHRFIDKDVGPRSEPAFAAGDVLGRERQLVDARLSHGEDPFCHVHGAVRGVHVAAVVGHHAGVRLSRFAVAVEHHGNAWRKMRGSRGLKAATTNGFGFGKISDVKTRHGCG